MKIQITTASLLLAVLLWLCAITEVEAPRVDWYRPAGAAAPAKFEVPKKEREFVRRLRERMEKVKEKKT